jgi:hypothetical protein
MLNKDTIMGFVRHVLTLVGGGLVSYGLADESVIPELVGAVITIVGFVWSAFDKQSRIEKN